MEKLEYTTDRFANTDQQVSEVITWGARYRDLVNRLGAIGTEVRIYRGLEFDKDVAPNNFIRNARHDFIFPPQPTAKLQDNSRPIDSTPGYQLFREDKTRIFDESLVEGRLSVRYDDSESRISLVVTDVMGDSVLDDKATEAINELRMAIELASPTPTV